MDEANFRWAMASTLAILAEAKAFACDVFAEHSSECRCQRCARANQVAASLKVLIEEADKLKRNGRG